MRSGKPACDLHIISCSGEARRKTAQRRPPTSTPPMGMRGTCRSPVDAAPGSAAALLLHHTSGLRHHLFTFCSSSMPAPPSPLVRPADCSCHHHAHTTDPAFPCLSCSLSSLLGCALLRSGTIFSVHLTYCPPHIGTSLPAAPAPLHDTSFSPTTPLPPQRPPLATPTALLSHQRRRGRWEWAWWRRHRIRRRRALALPPQPHPTPPPLLLLLLLLLLL